MAIIGMHALVYSKQAAKTRKFFGKVLKWASVDAGEGWPIYAGPPTELAVHPTDGREHHELFLMCDDIAATVTALKKKGVKLAHPVTDRGYGLVTAIKMPGGGELGLYEPRHPLAIKVKGRRAKKSAPRRAATR